MYTLRDYQDEAVDAALQAFTKGRPFIIQAATAAGKSLIISELCHRLGKPVLILQPSKEILEQNYAKLKSYGIDDIALYSASVGQKKIGRFTFATIQSIYKKPELFSHYEYAILDECHQLSPKKVDGMYMKFFREAGISKVCGLTATPFRLENKFIVASGSQFGSYTGAIKMLNRITRNSFFKDIAYKVEMHDLIDRGYLTAPQYHTYDTDLSALQVNTTGRDYTEESLERWSDGQLKRLASIAAHLDKTHQRVLVFCTSLRQAGRAVELLESLKIKAEALDGKTPKKQRESLIERFQDGRLKWVVNVGTMTTGFDCPPLDAVVLLRPTMSVPLYIQMLGRCLRLDPANENKEAHFYDFTGTVQKFGRAETIQLAKEDGFKDMLMSEVGRIDNEPLFSFQVKRKTKAKPVPKPRPEDITLEYLLSQV
jgi:DNA repair protein RadD